MAPQAAPDPTRGEVENGPGGSVTSTEETGDETGRGPVHRTARQTASSLGSVLWGWPAFAVLLSLGVLVFWAFDALPFQDLPAHAGLIAMRHRFADSAFEQRFFVLAPHLGPYSLFRFLGECLVGVIGPVRAVRAIACLPVIATPLALAFARKRLFGEGGPTYAFVGLALAFGLMTLLGFASYLLGVSAMLVGVTFWMTLAGAANAGETTAQTRKKELLVAAFSPLVFVAHGHAFLLYLFLAFLSALCAGGAGTVVRGGMKQKLAVALRWRALIPAVALAGWVAFIERGGTRPPGSAPVAAQNMVPHFQGVLDKLSLLLTPTLMTRTGVDLLVGVGIWVFAVSAVLRSLPKAGGQRGVPPRPTASTGEPGAMREYYARTLRTGAVALFVIFAALPHSIGWFGFVDGRLLPIVLYLALLSIQRDRIGPTHRAIFQRGAPIAALAVVSMALLSSYRFQEEARGYREVLAKVPVQARVLNLPLDPDSDVFAAHPFVHYDKLVLAERPIVVSDVWFHQGSALYPTAQNPALRLPSTYSESGLTFVDWPAYDLADWDYVLMRTRPDANGTGAPQNLHLVDHRGGWWLYSSRGLQ